MILSPVKATRRSKFKTRCASTALFDSPVAFGGNLNVAVYLSLYSLFLHAQHRHGGAQEAHRNTACIPTKRIKMSTGGSK